MYLIEEHVPFYMVKTVFLLEEKIWPFENVYVAYHGKPQLLMDSLLNVL